MARKTFIPRECLVCKKPFEGRTKRHIYCSKICQREIHSIQEGDYTTTSCVTTGAISELLVAADLLKRNYEVFRALSSGCSCDLAILRNGTLQRIEVRTCYRSKKGYLMNTNRKMKADILALYVKSTGEIIYHPPVRRF